MANQFDKIREVCYWEVPTEELDDTHTYTDRESYLEWVRQWKATYKSLTTEIRELKAQIRSIQKEQASPRAAAIPALWPIWNRRNRARVFATTLLIIRHDGKERSWKMKQAKLEKVS